jgi:dihydrodipicolinate reductase
MKIGLFGYGKMGRAIEALAQQQGAEVVWRANRENAGSLSDADLRMADAVIEFSSPEAAFENVMRCLRAGVPVVSGTTGWLEQMPAAEQYCRENNGALLWASNFSVGVNLFFALNRKLAELMAKWPEYGASVTETHHIHKKDAPSGTAITLANDLLASSGRYGEWALGSAPPGSLPIKAVRENEVPGTHLVRWQSAVDEISIEHRAHNRDGFALGALLAARWIVGKKGVFGMGDVL